jgi:hypothetical protein
MYGSLDGWTNGWKDVWMAKWLDEWVDGWKGEWMDQLMVIKLDILMGGKANRCLNGWMDSNTYGWMVDG